MDAMNGKKVSNTDWKIASKYAKFDLKRKCYIVVNEILRNAVTTIPITESGSDLICDEDYWNSVKFEINAL